MVHVMMPSVPQFPRKEDDDYTRFTESTGEPSKCQYSAWHQDQTAWYDCQTILWLEHGAGGGSLKFRDKRGAKSQDLQGELMAGAACGSCSLGRVYLQDRKGTRNAESSASNS